MAHRPWFLNPKQYYVPELPNGSIRDSDTGVMNVVMTMGVVGAVLLYAPFLAALFVVIRERFRRRGPASGGWIAFGSAVWLIMVLASSATLVIMFSAPGLEVCAFVIALCTAGYLGAEQGTSGVPVRQRLPSLGASLQRARP